MRRRTSERVWHSNPTHVIVTWWMGRSGKPKTHLAKQPQIHNNSINNNYCLVNEIVMITALLLLLVVMVMVKVMQTIEPGERSL